MGIRDRVKNIFASGIKSDWVIAISLLVVSASIRFPFLNAGLFHHDSAQLAFAVEKFVNNGELQGIGGGRHGLVLANAPFYYISKTVFGHESSEFAVNFVSAFFGVLAVLFLYLLVKELFNDRFIAFSSAMLYSTAPLFLSVSTFAKEHTLDTFIIILSLYLFIKGINTSKYTLIFISGIVFALLAFVRFPSIWAIFSIIYIAFNSDKISEQGLSNILNNKKFKTISIFIIPFLIILIIYFLLESGAFLNEAKSNFSPFSAENAKYILFYNLRYSGESILANLNAVGVLFSVIGLALLFREKKHLFYFLLLFFIPLFLLYASSKTVADRFFVVPLIALIISIAYSIGNIRKKNAYAGTIVLILFLIAFFANIYPTIKLRSKFSAFKELAGMINDNTLPGDSVVILYGDDTPAINYYSKTPTRTCDYQPDEHSIERFIVRIYGLMNDELKIYISGSCFGLGTKQERRLFLEIMDANFNGVKVAEYVHDDYHRSTVKPTLQKVAMIKLYPQNSGKGEDLRNFITI